MAIWLIGGLAVLVLGPACAWLGTRYGRATRGNLALASILLGFGEAIDPPPKHKVEDAEPGNDQPGPGEPPLTD
jgi:hypothetical protein